MTVLSMVSYPGLIVSLIAAPISPNTSIKVAKELSHHDVDMLDAPVTGSEPQAIEGSLTFMVGGKKDLYEKCMELYF